MRTWIILTFILIAVYRKPFFFLGNTSIERRPIQFVIKDLFVSFYIGLLRFASSDEREIGIIKRKTKGRLIALKFDISAHDLLVEQFFFCCAYLLSICFISVSSLLSCAALPPFASLLPYGFLSFPLPLLRHTFSSATLSRLRLPQPFFHSQAEFGMPTLLPSIYWRKKRVKLQRK